MSDPFAEAALLMADSRYALGREYSAPLTGTVGRLELPRGAAYLTIRDGGDPSMLFQARFGSPMAEVVEEGGTVSVIYHRHGGLKREKYEGVILLNAGVPWAIACHGGVASMRANLRALRLSSLAISFGVHDVEVDLGTPHDVVPISIAGGVSQVTLRRPSGAAARLRIKGGASHLTFDQQYFESAGGTMMLATSGVDAVAERYEIQITGGLSNVKVLTFDDSAE